MVQFKVFSKNISIPQSAPFCLQSGFINLKNICNLIMGSCIKNLIKFIVAYLLFARHFFSYQISFCCCFVFSQRCLFFRACCCFSTQRSLVLCVLVIVPFQHDPIECGTCQLQAIICKHYNTTHRWSTCVLIYFSWLLDHMIYLKLRRYYYCTVKLSKFTK